VVTRRPASQTPGPRFPERHCVPREKHPVLRRAPTWKPPHHGSLATGYDQRFWTLPIVCNWRRWARVRLHVALDLAVCTAVNIVSNSLERPGKDSLPTVSQSTSLGIGRQRPEEECGNDTRRPINPEQQNIYLYIELNISIFKQVADEFDGACQVLNGRGPQPLPGGCRLGADSTSVGCLPRVLHFRSARDTSAKVADRNLRRSVSPGMSGRSSCALVTARPRNRMAGLLGRRLARCRGRGAPKTAGSSRCLQPDRRTGTCCWLKDSPPAAPAAARFQ